jgi:hypothetical protein
MQNCYLQHKTVLQKLNPIMCIDDACVDGCDGLQDAAHAGSHVDRQGTHPGLLQQAGGQTAANSIQQQFELIVWE